MTDRDEMSDSIKGALPVVGGDAVYRGQLDRAANGHGWYASANDLAKNFVSHLGAASGHDEPVDTMIREGLQASSFLMNTSSGRGNKCCVSGFIEDLFCSIDEFR